jgi:NAD(P)-dependent dehydrogenase (short-subunit alcohol dehydrogenase family)
MKIDFTRQTAVVAGASRGIGRLAVTPARTVSVARVNAGALHSSAEPGNLTVEGTVTTRKADLTAAGGLTARARSPTRPCWPGTT